MPLVTAYEGRNYIGTLLIDDAAFCLHVYFILQGQRGRSIEEIGSLDMSYPLAEKPSGPDLSFD